MFSGFKPFYQGIIKHMETHALPLPRIGSAVNKLLCTFCQALCSAKTVQTGVRAFRFWRFFCSPQEVFSTEEVCSLFPFGQKRAWKKKKEEG